VIVLELVAMTGGQDRRGHGDEIFVFEPPLFRSGNKGASNPHHRVGPDFQVQVRSAVLDGNLQEVVDVHGPLLIGRSSLGL
jgi:hypothetical protein